MRSQQRDLGLELVAPQLLNFSVSHGRRVYRTHVRKSTKNPVKSPCIAADCSQTPASNSSSRAPGPLTGRTSRSVIGSPHFEHVATSVVTLPQPLWISLS